MQDKLAWTGASSNVNVLVLHSQYGTMNAYRMLPNSNASEPTGECCETAGTDQDCCQSEAISLADLNIDSFSGIDAPGVLENFFTYVMDHYPARHVMISGRGVPSWPYFLPGAARGFTAREYASKLQIIADRLGHKVDVVNLGFCESGIIDWPYQLKDVADYYVGSANFTNPPVSSRWRFYSWVRYLINNPRPQAEIWPIRCQRSSAKRLRPASMSTMAVPIQVSPGLAPQLTCPNWQRLLTRACRDMRAAQRLGQ